MTMPMVPVEQAEIPTRITRISIALKRLRPDRSVGFSLVMGTHRDSTPSSAINANVTPHIRAKA